MIEEETLKRSQALWNRERLDLTSDEILAQILDRGSMEDWRALYSLARKDGSLRQRMRTLLHTVPLPFPHFWLAALASLGETEIDWSARLPKYGDSGI